MTHDRHVIKAPSVSLRTSVPAPPAAEQDVVPAAISHQLKEKGFLEEALRRTDGVQVKAAELLRMSYRSFRHYMQKYDIPS